MPRPLHSASAPGRGRELSRKRRRWEELYRTGDPHQFRWLEDEVPPHLLELLRRRDLVDGAALDIGCGPGTITMTLATRFRPTVGLDLSLAAVTRARAQPVPRDGVRPSFLVAAAPDMPFPDGLFSFVFDRGCLQALPVREWPVYLERVAHLLKPGGMFQ